MYCTNWPRFSVAAEKNALPSSEQDHKCSHCPSSPISWWYLWQRITVTAKSTQQATVAADLAHTPFIYPQSPAEERME